jgi:hypothetical protein
MHGIGLLSVTKTDSANFPSDFNLPVVIFLLDYPSRAVVEILAAGAAYEVEFCDRDGRPYASLGSRPEQLIVLHYEPVPTHSS